MKYKFYSTVSTRITVTKYDVTFATKEGFYPPPPSGCAQWIFIHGTNIVERGLKVLFFGLFFHCLLPPPLEEAQ